MQIQRILSLGGFLTLHQIILFLTTGQRENDNWRGSVIVVGEAINTIKIIILEQNKLCKLLIIKDKHTIKQKNGQSKTKGFIHSIGAMDNRHYIPHMQEMLSVDWVFLKYLKQKISLVWWHTSVIPAL